VAPSLEACNRDAGTAVNRSQRRRRKATRGSSPWCRWNTECNERARWMVNRCLDGWRCWNRGKTSDIGHGLGNFCGRSGRGGCQRGRRQKNGCQSGRRVWHDPRRGYTPDQSPRL